MTNQEIISPGLLLENVKVIKVILDQSKLDQKDMRLDIQTELIDFESDLTRFSLRYNITIFEAIREKPTIENAGIYIVMDGCFLVPEGASAIQISNYKHQSSPMILFPYLRAYITNITSASGLDPIILPSIFIKLTPPESEDKLVVS
jgi:preprotein translocase subunit SecB